MKIEKYNTAPTKKPLQAQDRCDNSDNNLLSLPDSDDDPGNKSDLSDHDHAYDRVGDAFKGDIEDTSAHGDRDNAGNNGDTFNGDIEDTSAHDDDADSSSDSYVAYDPGGISNDSTLDSATQDSADNTTNNSSPSLTHAPSPFDNDAADGHHSDDADDRGRDTVLDTTDNSLDLIKGDDSRIVYDPGGIGFSKDSALGGINDGDGSSLPYDPGGNTNDESDIDNSVGRNIAYDPGGDIHNNHGLKHVYDPGGNH